METIEKTSTPDLSWVPASGGPEVQCEDGRNVTGLPEEGWWVMSAKYRHPADVVDLNLHTKWTEPVTGATGTLMVELRPSREGEGVAWRVSFVIETPDGESRYPMRVYGDAPDFDAAHRAAVAWRPMVQIIDGVELWTDPASMRGEVRGLHSGELTWQPSTELAGSIAWCFKPAGLKELDLFEWHCNSINGTAEMPKQMLDQVAEARERMRSAMRKFLLNF